MAKVTEDMIGPELLKISAGFCTCDGDKSCYVCKWNEQIDKACEK